LPSSFADTLAPRDRRALRLGALAVAAVVVVAAAMPAARAWRDREALIDARRAELARVRGLVEATPAFRAAVESRSGAVLGYAQRPLRAATGALAAGELQGELQRLAEESGLTVDQLDVTGDADSVAAPLPAIPATLVALGDVQGVADLLAKLRSGPHLVEVRELAVQVNPALKASGGGELLQLTLVVRAPWTTD
jgi:hypothetical protein